MDAVDSGRLRFVARNFTSLQGLRQAPMGMFFLLTSFLKDKDWALSVLGVAGIIGAWRIGAYYERRFGRAEARDPNSKYRFAAVVLLIGLAAGLATLFKMAPISLIMPLIVFTLFWSSSGKRWYYLPFVAIFLALAFWQRNRSVDVTSLRCLLFGLYLIVTGILDHLLLVRSLPGLRQGCDD